MKNLKDYKFCRIDEVQKVIDEDPKRGYKRRHQYETVGKMLKNLYPEELRGISNSVLEELVYHATHGTRDWRELTKEYERDEKQKASDKWKWEHGYGNPNQTLFEMNIGAL